MNQQILMRVVQKRMNPDGGGGQMKREQRGREPPPLMRLSLRRKARRGIWDDRFLNGHPKVNASLHPVIMRAVAFGLDVTSTRDGVHAPKSFHYEGRAVDFGSNRGFRPWTLQKLLRFQRREHTRHGKGYYVYTGLGFFRQLPAGVPGAYRLFANLISLGK